MAPSLSHLPVDLLEEHKSFLNPYGSSGRWEVGGPTPLVVAGPSTGPVETAVVNTFSTDTRQGQPLHASNPIEGGPLIPYETVRAHQVTVRLSGRLARPPVEAISELSDQRVHRPSSAILHRRRALGLPAVASLMKVRVTGSCKVTATVGRRRRIPSYTDVEPCRATVLAQTRASSAP